MASREKVAGYFWVKVSIGFGLILGLLLLVQTVGTYRYVSRGLVRQEAQNEADRKVTGINRLLRNTAHETADYKSSIDEIVRDSPQTVAWIRILNSGGAVIAAGGNLAEAPKWTEESLRNELMQRGQHHQDVRRTTAGEILLGFGPAPGARRKLSPRGDLKEAAANLFAMLRELDAEAAAIAVMPIPESGLGEAINDRLRRAAS